MRSGIEKCPITYFSQLLARVPKNILGKVNNSLFYKLQVLLVPGTVFYGNCVQVPGLWVHGGESAGAEAGPGRGQQQASGATCRGSARPHQDDR